MCVACAPEHRHGGDEWVGDSHEIVLCVGKGLREAALGLRRDRTFKSSHDVVALPSSKNLHQDFGRLIALAVRKIVEKGKESRDESMEGKMCRHRFRQDVLLRHFVSDVLDDFKFGLFRNFDVFNGLAPEGFLHGVPEFMEGYCKTNNTKNILGKVQNIIFM